MLKTLKVQIGKTNEWSFAVSVGKIHCLFLFFVSPPNSLHPIYTVISNSYFLPPRIPEIGAEISISVELKIHFLKEVFLLGQVTFPACSQTTATASLNSSSRRKQCSDFLRGNLAQRNAFL